MGLFSKFFGAKNKNVDTAPKMPEQSITQVAFIDSKEYREKLERKNKKTEYEFQDKMHILETKTEEDETPTICGFSFDIISFKEEKIVDLTTGEIEHNKKTFVFDETNFNKVRLDVIGLNNLFSYINEIDHTFPSPDKVVSILKKNSRVCSTDELKIDCTAKVSDRKQDGTLRKYPITVSMIIDTFIPNEIADGFISSKTEDTFIFHLSYLENGVIGKGEFYFWHNKIGYGCRFDNSKGRLYVKTLLYTNNEVENSRWVTYYKSGDPIPVVRRQS